MIRDRGLDQYSQGGGDEKWSEQGFFFKGKTERFADGLDVG